MPSQPQYGGGNGVEELDAGQPGSARAAANTAKYTVQTTDRAAPPRIVTHELPQNTAAFQDVLGPGRSGYEWRGLLKVNTMQTWLDIKHQILKLIDGHLRTAAGDLDAFSQVNVRPTTLTNGLGLTVSTFARIVSFQVGGRVRKITGSATFHYAIELSLAFTT